MDSGLSTMSEFSHSSSRSSTVLLNRTSTIQNLRHLRCDPSIINYMSHHLLTTHHSDLFQDDHDDYNITVSSSSSFQVPLAESSRRTAPDTNDTEQMLLPDDEDHHGPLTSTFIDHWYRVIKPYTATFRQDLTVRKTESVQVLRSSHPHWVWVRNESSKEGFIPTDCLVPS